MRFLLPFLILAAPAALPAQPAKPAKPAMPAMPAMPAAPTSPTGGLFLSPMGEPFRTAEDNVGAWFAGADRDGDRALAAAEMRGDSERFFDSLDSDRDGELEMVEIARYENEIAPEVQVGLQMRETGVGDWRGGRSRRVLFYEGGLEGGARFSFLNIPHPVIAADGDMNRGVSRSEFSRAAAERFALLDKDRDGRVVRAELPPLPRPRLRRPRDENRDPFPTPIGTPQG